ncbi:MAG: hypothetical protein K2P09_07680 [Erysipelotrichales bacterium]|nr:hypothetical protein [Erysipelotrichales bacterium]
MSTSIIYRFIDKLELKGLFQLKMLVSSQFDYADYQLYFCSYENKEEKIASFSSKLSLQYLLDCLYVFYLSRRYKENLNYHIHYYKEL